MEEKKETFTYTYSAAEQEEIRRIRSKYAPPTREESSMERLRRLDAGATKGAATVSLTMGIAGTLLLGIGMCCSLVWAGRFFLPGIVIGVAGIAGVLAAYPIYTRMVKRKRAKLTPEIMRLTDELMK